MTVLSFWSVAGEITRVPTTRVPPPYSILLIGYNAYAPSSLILSCAKALSVDIEPPDGFEPPYHAYEARVLAVVR